MAHAICNYYHIIIACLIGRCRYLMSINLIICRWLNRGFDLLYPELCAFVLKDFSVVGLFFVVVVVVMFEIQQPENPRHRGTGVFGTKNPASVK